MKFMYIELGNVTTRSTTISKKRKKFRKYRLKLAAPTVFMLN